MGHMKYEKYNKILESISNNYRKEKTLKTIKIMMKINY